MELTNLYGMLVNSLKLLSLPYDAQRASLPDFVDVQEDVLSDFFEAFLRLPPIIEAEMLSYSAIAYIIRLNNMIVLAEPGETVTGLEEFKDSEKWNEIRKVSGEILITLKE